MIKSELEDSDCTAFLLQDLGALGPDGHPRLQAALEEHQVITNSHPHNKSRTVALIINKNWKIVGPIRKDGSGCVIGTTVEKDGARLFLASVYMPTALSIYGSSMVIGQQQSSPQNLVGNDLVQWEAHNAYAMLKEWCEREPYWIVGGDFNETRNESLDRMSQRKRWAPPQKFISDFLEATHGLDVWRHLFPNTPGYTYTNGKNASSRLDYFISGPLFANRPKKMMIANWSHKKDHARITFRSSIPAKQTGPCNGPTDDIPRPRLEGVPEGKVMEIKQACNEALEELLHHPFEEKDPDPDLISRMMASLIVDSAIQITGRKASKKRKTNRTTAKLVSEIRTIQRARDLIRSLTFKEVPKDQEKATSTQLEHLLDRLTRMGLSSVPVSNNLRKLQQWADGEALQDLTILQEYAQLCKKDIRNKERQDLRKLFCNPSQKGKWLEYYFGKPSTTTPNFAIDPDTGSQVFDPDKIKALYLQEGTLSLKTAYPAPPPFDAKEHSHPPPQVPREEKRESFTQSKPSSRPSWWDKMYDRKAKNIEPETWQGLMDPVSPAELLDTIKKCGKGKAAGYDGVSIDLISILTEDGPPEKNICLTILAWLVSQAFANGKSLKSWRKAVISMVPKRKEDGSFTNLIREMRPISVLQEFGKLASKVLAERIGRILLKRPKILSNAQRAFLRDGSVRQCIATLINIFEDFKDKRKSDDRKNLFFLAYDQVKAYDSVQGFTIQASLERFNLPEEFITYVLSGLEDASSMFKTFHGLTEEFPITTSVRQGDPLSPLVYIFITDALHEGLRNNPIYGCKTGYRFSNNPKIRVSSLGYADDTSICAESWKDIWMMHEWVREFCYYHKFQLNSGKCKYFISNYYEQDNRWLWSVDGSSKLHPQSPGTPFRYLGIWLTMNLDWKEQIQTLNRMVMDWRRRAIIGQIDPAQLKSSVTELLLPKMELGLLFANVTEKMCNAWTATIVFTLSRRMSTAHTINRFGFCFLSDIPHLWFRTQTIRVTELLVNLNTTHCAVGSTTRARLCRLTHPPSSDPEQVLHYYKKVGINKRDSNRIALTLQYLKKVGALIISTKSERTKYSDKIAELVASELKQTFLDTPEAGSFHVYTDGSTHPGNKSWNSGVGIYVTDGKHNQVWKGGFHVRSDKNNFVAEMAAASTVINAVPEKTKCTIWIDSMATIQALKKGTLLSERKRVRAAGRLWLNWARPLLDSPHIQFQHVRSHTGNSSPSEVGNGMADSLANFYRLQGEKLPPDHVHLEWEEPFCIQAADMVVQGDPRSWAKAIEQDSLLKAWSESKLQSKWIKKNRKQVKRMAEEVWKWAIEIGDGGAWIYFIFAISNWLPTRRRTGKRRTKDRVPVNPYLRHCSLCLTGEVEDLEHMMRCPALLGELEAMSSSVNAVLCKYGLGANSPTPKSERLREDWLIRARSELAEPSSPDQYAITTSRLSSLLDDWISTKGTERAFRHFIEIAKERLRISVTASENNKGNYWNLPKVLQTLLVERLSLTVEGLTDALHHSEVLEEWWSSDDIDKNFGAKVDWRKQECAGRNIFVNPQSSDSEEDQKVLYDFITKAKDELKQLAPTRFLFVVPHSKEPGGGKAFTMAVKARFLEIARFKKDSLESIPPNAFRSAHPIVSPNSIQLSLFLGINKESLLRDPIPWNLLCDELRKWALLNGGSLTIPDHTNALFQEREISACAPRVRYGSRPTKASLLRFFNSIETEAIHPVGCHFVENISKINNWPKPLGFLGLLPYHLRQELKNRTGNVNAATHVSKTIFLAGYQVWKTRLGLVKKLTQAIPKPKTGDEQCSNPFHYLKKIANFNSLKMGMCKCYHLHVPRLPDRDIRDWLIPKQPVVVKPSEDPVVGDWIVDPQLDDLGESKKEPDFSKGITMDSQQDTSGLDLKYPPNHQTGKVSKYTTQSNVDISLKPKENIGLAAFAEESVASHEMPLLSEEELNSLSPSILALFNTSDSEQNQEQRRTRKKPGKVFFRRKRRKKKGPPLPQLL